MIKFIAWIKAFRLRTLPLALSSTLMGSLVAYTHKVFDVKVFGLATVTTLFLQILSNLANDYGDTQNGADHDGRKGPERMVQSGLISLVEMKRMIGVFIGLSLISGVWLIIEAFMDIDWRGLVFFILGLASIAAALKYTMGKNPYGYKGLGDFFVFVFFGLVGVIGTYYLHSHVFNWTVVLPAVAVGFLSAGVLNVNNMRDIESDRLAKKNTLAVKYGLKVMRRYHLFLIVGALVLLILFLVLNASQGTMQWMFLFGFTPLIFHLKTVLSKSDEELDPELKRLALSTFVIVLLFGLGQYLSV